MVVSSQRCKEHLIPVVSECLSTLSFSYGSWRCITEYLTAHAGCLSGKELRLDKMCVHASFCCIPESNKTLQINYPSIKRKRKDKNPCHNSQQFWNNSQDLCLFYFLIRKERSPCPGVPTLSPMDCFYTAQVKTLFYFSFLF